MPNLLSPLRVCKDPAKPLMDCLPSQLYGIPAGTSGRMGQTIKGIVIHCLNVTIEEYDRQVCNVGGLAKLHRLSGTANSLHYAISLQGGIHNYIADDDIAYGLDLSVPLGTTSPVYHCPGVECPVDPCNPTPPPVYNYAPLWTLTSEQAGVPFDYYLLHIGIEAPQRRIAPPKGYADTPCSPCADGNLWHQFGAAQLRSLIHLLAYLANIHQVQLDANHVNFWHAIDPCERDQCGCNPCIEQLLCEVSDYCEGPKHAADQTYTVGDNLVYVYGEDIYGTKTAVPVATFLKNNLRNNGGTLEYYDASVGNWLPILSAP